MGAAAAPPVRAGRQPSTTVAELSHIGIRLFLARGFDETTVEDVAEAAGIGRRTFFRYFASKNDLPWGDFDALIATMRQHLSSMPREVPPLAALRTAVLEFNRFPPAETAFHRQRMTLLLTVPTLIGHSTLRYADWRLAVAEFVADRLGLAVDDLLPQTIAYASLAASIAAYEAWLRDPGSSLEDLLGAALDHLGSGFAGAVPG